MKKITLLLIVLMAFAFQAPAQSTYYGFNLDNILMFIRQSEKQLNPEQCSMVGNGTMMGMAKSPKAYRRMLELAEQRIGNPLDSLHNEEIYIAILKHAVDSFALSPSEKVRPRLLLANAMKNRLGETATDIDFITPDDVAHKLSDYRGAYTLLYFNDTECDACEQMKVEMEQSAIVKQLATDGNLNVLGIYTGTNKKQWKKSHAPAFMVNGWDSKQQVENDETYVLSTLPIFYLLDKDGAVIMKNEVRFSRIEAALTLLAKTDETASEELVKLLFNLQ